MPEQRTVKRNQLIEPPEPIRFAMDQGRLDSLAASIRRYGIILPLAVCEVEYDADHELSRRLQIDERKEGLRAKRLEIIDGHRRFVAAGMAALEEVPVIVFASVEEAKFGMMLDTNVEREDITAAEEGAQFLEVAEKRGWSIAEICRHFGKSEDYINQRVGLVQKFSDLIAPVAERRITWAQAKAMMRCSDPQYRAYMVDQADTHGASARTLTYMVDQWKTALALQQGAMPLHTPEHGQPAVVQSNPKCLWCDRDDDPANIVPVNVHSYHKRDLETFLESVGVSRPARAT